jgi:acid phosphatase type 7
MRVATYAAWSYRAGMALQAGGRRFDPGPLPLLLESCGALTQGLLLCRQSVVRRYDSGRIMATGGLALVVSFCGTPSDQSSKIDAPAAAFTDQCTGELCTFNDGSSDSDGTIVTQSWDFGDGSGSAQPDPAHTYAQPGTYTVKLSVADDSGETAVASRSVVVDNASVVLMGAGDIADCATGSPQSTAAVLAQYPTATVFTLGDNAYENGSPTDYSQCYQPTWGHFKGRTDPAPGNHDYQTSGAAGYFGYFGASAGPAGRGYYSYDLGGWHIISLDSEIGVDSASAQATWLRQDLADHPAMCTLAYWHRPLFTSGLVHFDDTSMRPIFSILYAAGADIILSGHNHQYERFAPQRPDGTRDDSAGIREFVVGTGGAWLYGFRQPEPNSEVRYQGYGVLKLTLGATNYAWEFVPVAGSSFSDSGTGNCH